MPSFPIDTARRAFVAVCLVFSGFSAALAQTSAAATGSFFVVHGIPGRDVSATLDPLLPVDVLVDNSICLVKGLNYEGIAGPFTVPAATYDVKISLANSVTPCSNSAVIDASVTVTANAYASVVAALSPTGTPTAYAFADDLSKVGKLDTRVIAAHAANGPTVNIRLKSPNGDEFFIDKLSAGSVKIAELPGYREYTITVAPPGSKILAAVRTILFPYQSAGLIFVVGSAASNTIVVLTKIIPGVL